MSEATVWVVAIDRGYGQAPEVVGLYATEQDARDSLAEVADPDAPFWHVCELPLGKFLGVHWDRDVEGFSAYRHTHAA